MTTHDEHTDRQFGPQATAYLTSAVHAQGEDLLRVAASFAGHRSDCVLDLGCGAGHLAFAVAPQVRCVTAYDLSPAMLQTVATAARERGLANVETAQGRCEALPFADASFDAVVTRYSAHHWGDLPRALAEARRVLKPSGRIIVIDAMAPASRMLDSHLQTIELLRDGSHVRDASLSEWQAMLEGAGFAVTGQRAWKVHIDFASWTARMRTPADRAAVILSLWESAPAEVRAHFEVRLDGSFEFDTLQIEAVPAAAPRTMRRFHIALAVRELDASIADYSVRLGQPPTVVVAGRYAMWRTEQLNFSINPIPDRAGTLRHVGFEDESAERYTSTSDVNGIEWEHFSVREQDDRIASAYGSPSEA